MQVLNEDWHGGLWIFKNIFEDVISFLKYILLIMLLQLSHFSPFTPLCPAYHLPPTFPPLVHVRGSYI